MISATRWPASSRNGGRLQIGTTAGIISEYVAGFDRNPHSERTVRLIDQMELQLEELEAKATEDELAAAAMSRQASVPAPMRRRPSRKPFPQYLPRERVVIAGPTSCPCCGSVKLSKLGEDVTEKLEVIPRSWKVIR